MANPVDNRQDILREVRRISHFMDSAIRIPFTRMRFGFDSIVGLLPGGGDAVGLAISLYLVYRARQMGVSGSTLARMVANVLIDSAVGAIPIAGDVFDVFFKANRKNFDLILQEFGPEIEQEKK